MSFQIIRNDITRVKADAIVNTANPEPIYGAGTDLAIYNAAGAEELLAERKKIGKIKVGQAVYTPAFALDAKYIIHTVGPIWEGGMHHEEEKLKECYYNSLRLASQLGCRSVAFSLISTGSYGYPYELALRVALSTIQSYVIDNDINVILVVFGDRAFKLSARMVDKVIEYVDSHYVGLAEQREYYDEYYRYKEHIRKEREMKLESRCMSIDCEQDNPKVDIMELVNSAEKTFQEKLFEIIDEKGLSSTQVYKGYVSKQVYSKLQSDKNYNPKKNTAIALCLSLKLNLDQTLDILGRAGWTLSPSDKRDLVIKGCIQNKMFNKVDDMLDLMGYPTILKYDDVVKKSLCN